MTNESLFDVFVIGAGVSGLTLAEKAARLGLRVCIAEELMFGGLVLNVNHLHPGLEGLPGSGSDLCAELMTRVSDLGVEMLFEPVSALSPETGGALQITTSGGSHAARTAVIASGARLRKLGVPGEEEFEHRGVAHCADCDAPMYQGETAVVVGGGDSALQEALVLAEFCSAVHLVHRGKEFTARTDFVDAVRASQRLQVHLGTVVEAILGEQQVTGVRVRNLVSGETGELACKGIFAYVGLEPNVGFLPPWVEMDGGAVRVTRQLETSLPNVFAVGAVRAGYAGMLTDAVQDASTVANSIATRLGRA